MRSVYSSKQENRKNGGQGPSQHRHGYLDLTKSLRETKSATAGVKWNSQKTLVADMLNMGIQYYHS